MQPFEEVNDTVWDLPADIFIPAAALRLVYKEHVVRLVANGLEVISSGANVPFADREIFYGPSPRGPMKSLYANWYNHYEFCIFTT